MKEYVVLMAGLAMALAASNDFAMASSLTPADDGVHVDGYDLSAFGIVPASWTNLENDVKVRVLKKGKKGAKGSMLKVTAQKGGINLFNLKPTDNFSIKDSSYKLTARFEADGKLRNGKHSKVTINGNIMAEEGTVSGKLLTARLGDLLNGSDYVLAKTLIGFNTHNVKCHAFLESISPGGCESDAFAYVYLDKRLGDFTKKYKSTGLAVTGSAAMSAVPVPAAVWLFSSGLLGLIGMARRHMQ